MFLLGVLVASGAAVAYGISTVLRAMGARNAAIADHQDALPLTAVPSPALPSTVGTFRNRRFLLGTGFLLLGFAGGAVAARILPLFLSQTIVSANLIVTALIGSLALNNTLHARDWVAMATVVFSLCALGVSSAHHSGGGQGRDLHWALFVSTLVLSGLALLAIWQLAERGGLLYGALAGVMFGVIAVGVRVLDGVSPFDPGRLLMDPAAWTIAIAGSVGFYVQTVALQVGRVNGVTAMLVVGETAAPGLIGVLFLGDAAQPGLVWLAYTGFAGAVVGAVLVALYNADESDHFDEWEPPPGGWSLRRRYGTGRKTRRVSLADRIRR
ncbi:hypothetical protein [Tomitella biformata]|uniref:hypothetical protein n=1 Tax=Tomitella biformata TaxID=630403 RepID=UPI0004675659|nr:hypothetical protein [Tomitella biformata]